MAKKTIALFLVLFLFCCISVYADNVPTFFDDVVSPLFSSKMGLVAPTFDEAKGTYYFSKTFAVGQEQYVFVSFQVPHEYKDNSTMYCHVHAYASTNMTTSYVSLRLNYTWYNINETRAATFTNSATINITNGSALQQKLYNIVSINGTNKTYSSSFFGKITRLSTDNYTGDLYIDFFDCHIEKEQFSLTVINDTMIQIAIIFGFIALITYFLYLGYSLSKKDSELVLSRDNEGRPKFKINMTDLGVTLNVFSILLVDALLVILANMSQGESYASLISTMSWVGIIVSVAVLIIYVLFYVSFKSALTLFNAVQLQKSKQKNNRG